MNRICKASVEDIPYLLNVDLQPTTGAPRDDCEPAGPFIIKDWLVDFEDKPPGDESGALFALKSR